MSYSVSDTHQQTMPNICWEMGKKRNALCNGIKQLQQMANTDQQTKIKQNSHKFGKPRFPFVKACLCKHVWQVFTVNSSSWSVTGIAEEDLKKKCVEDAF